MSQLLLDDQEWAVHHGDCIERMAEMPAQSVDFSVFSPPFPSIFSYTNLSCDLGNCNDLHRESKLHFSFFFKQMIKVMKPGRVMMVHCTQIPALTRNGEKGTFDFRGMLIRLARRAGFTYEYDWLIGRNPQAQAIRTHSHSLLFVTLERDSAKSRGALGDYVIKFSAPGENQEPILAQGEISRNDWIDWAECYWPWGDIKETETLNTYEGKGDDDTRHICPLQLETIRRLVLLYSNPGEIVFSPFTGIGSEGYVSLKHERRFYGCEIKDEYYAAACKNLERAIESRESQLAMF